MSHPEHGPLTEQYRRVENEDVPEYDKAVGPGGFECVLTEPEDRNFYRDAKPLLTELNRLHAELASLRADLATCFDAAWHADGNFNNANCADCLAFGELAVKHGRARKDGGRFVFLEPNAAEEGK